jgi:exonuclease SbcC
LDRAVKLVEATRDSIIGGVKQSIELQMSRFLPALTDNRYSTVQIDENEYKIRVWDREARGWREKGVFSGGTQDQFSLALRLSFALSTIPENRGARPGFIFLDEPLSSFDPQRRNGFVRLLTGQLSNNFPQIIIVSHIEQLQEEFANLIQLDSGRVVRPFT